MYERPRVSVKVERGSTFTFTRDLPSHIVFFCVCKIYVRTHIKITRQWKSTYRQTLCIIRVSCLTSLLRTCKNIFGCWSHNNHLDPSFIFTCSFLLLSYVEWFLTAIACKGPPRYLARSLFYIPSILSTVQKWRVLFIGNIKHLMNGHE